MKNLRYILLAILLGLNLTSCEPPTLTDEVGVEELETTSLQLTEEEDEDVGT